MIRRCAPLFVLLPAFAAAESTQAEAVYAKAEDAVFVIRTEHTEGTAFAIGKGSTIITNRHVIRDALDIRVMNTKGAVVRSVRLGSGNLDLAILEMSKPLTTRPLKLRTTDPKIGENVYAVGTPQGLEKTLTTGVVSSVRRMEDVKYVQHTASISQGSSGSPLLDKNAQVIGVNTSYLSTGQSLNFAIATGHIRMLQKAAASNFKPDPARAKRQAEARALIRKLERDDDEVNYDIFQKLRPYGGDAVAALLSEMSKFHAETEEVHEGMADAFSWLGGLAEAPLLNAFKRGTPDERVTAGYSLYTAAFYYRYLKDGGEIEGLTLDDLSWINGVKPRRFASDAVDSSDPDHQIYGARLAGELGLEGTVPRLEEILDEEETADVVWWEVYAALVELYGRNEITRLFDYIEGELEVLEEEGEEDADYGTLEALIEPFGAARNPAALHALEVLKDHEDEQVRLYTAIALGVTEQDGALALLRTLLKDRSDYVRAAAAFSAAGQGIPPDEIKEIVMGFAQHEDMELRTAAAGALGYLEVDWARDRLKDLLKDKESDVRVATLIAFQLQGLKAYIPDIRPLLEDPEPEVRKLARETIDFLEEFGR